ncbi:P-type ATPase [Tieghemostelium lacteum]|uniref:Phospholipid-transporting ATPase n=1 Tax=Tieghemostelium lacteum TaxID=361077 RepID=A0A151Z720_TIELA|nr:P-type ATPase [Tieghemostelium lacteum]|eukprot:KYQ89727.1 P-type ATPase [Tieghemostelium lacteum]
MSCNILEKIGCKIKKRKSISKNRRVDVQLLNTEQSSNCIFNQNSDNCNNKKERSKTNWISTTKYSIITFLPKNLFEQFCRVANLYFLFILILQQLPISPVQGVPSILNLGIVLLINAVKEAYEDFKRYKSDKKINYQRCTVVDKGKEVKKDWKDLRVGDIVKVYNEQQFPADMVLLSSSSEASEGQCYIETSNLDGETNLKCKRSLMETNYLREVTDFYPLKTVLEYESPSLNLHKFDGRMTLTQQDGSTQTLPLNIEQLLIRGTTLMNTKWIYGVIVYTGHETKYMLNTMSTPSKRSKLERAMNKMLIYILVAEACLCLASAFIGLALESRVGRNSFYLALNHRYGLRTVERFFTFVVLYSTMVPISLYVTMEVVRVFQVMLINRDKKMYHQETNTFATARTSNLNEELGQVEYIFSDKTGTLTRNEMEFRMCCINGQVFGTMPTSGEKSQFSSLDNLKLALDQSQQKLTDSIEKPFHIDFSVPENFEFFLVMAICNTVIPETVECSDDPQLSTIKYSSSSPDEIALVNAASLMGFKYHSRSPNSIGININGEEKVYTILNVLEFTSDRKRMSIIVKELNSSEIILYCKGADTSILPYVKKNNNYTSTNNLEIKDSNGIPSTININSDGCDGCDGSDGSNDESQTSTTKVNNSRQEEIQKENELNLKKFSCNGLRTLCIAKKVIPLEEYEPWNVLYKEASISITNRDINLQNVSALIENDWELLGITGIEDKLQQNVTSTISTLSAANIKIFMLTGDKQETAINIGLSCQLLSNCELVIINNENVEGLKSNLESSIQRIVSSRYNSVQAQHNGEIPLEIVSNGTGASQQQDYGLVIDGQTLGLILSTGKEMEDLFFDLGKLCKSIICCRVTPFQKSEVVRIYKDRTDSITLAIGDGANDVSMIQKAHIGIGISGKEGRQAVLASDYAISQFRYLERMVLVHGRYNYKRLCLLICFFFFKNLSTCLLQLWYSTNTQFSGQTFYDAVNILGYNLIFTSLPIIVMGVFEKDIDPKYLRRYPQLYRECQLGKCFNHKIFWSWIVFTIYSSACVYFFTSKIYIEGATDDSGRVGGQWLTSAAGFTALIFVVSLRLAILVQSWTPWHHLTIWGSLIVYSIVESCYSLIYLNYTSYFHMVFITLVNQPIFFIALILTVVTALLPAYTVTYIKRNYFAQPIHIAQEIQRREKELERKKLKKSYVNNNNNINNNTSIHNII